MWIPVCAGMTNIKSSFCKIDSLYHFSTVVFNLQWFLYRVSKIIFFRLITVIPVLDS